MNDAHTNNETTITAEPMLWAAVKNQYRDVVIPKAAADVTLDDVYHYGQNDVQPVDGCPSLSVGSVIHFASEDKLYIVMSFGFAEITDSEYRRIRIAVGRALPADRRGIHDEDAYCIARKWVNELMDSKQQERLNTQL